MIPVESSAIRQVGYEAKGRVLRVSFVNGRTYEYFDVPLGAYAELMQADSKGSYFNHHIRPSYRYRRVR